MKEKLGHRSRRITALTSGHREECEPWSCTSHTSCTPYLGPSSISYSPGTALRLFYLSIPCSLFHP